LRRPLAETDNILPSRTCLVAHSGGGSAESVPSRKRAFDVFWESSVLSLQSGLFGDSEKSELFKTFFSMPAWHMYVQACLEGRRWGSKTELAFQA
jgi:hypothetical protein